MKTKQAYVVVYGDGHKSFDKAIRQIRKQERPYKHTKENDAQVINAMQDALNRYVDGIVRVCTALGTKADKLTQKKRKLSKKTSKRAKQSEK